MYSCLAAAAAAAAAAAVAATATAAAQKPPNPCGDDDKILTASATAQVLSADEVTFITL